MAITASDIREHFAEFENLSDAKIDRWLAQAERRINTTQWGEKADDGLLWLTAHLLKIQCDIATAASGGTGSPSGPVSSKKVGDLSVTYSAPVFTTFRKATDRFLASTTYGQYYLDLKSTVFATRVLGDCDGC